MRALPGYMTHQGPEQAVVLTNTSATTTGSNPPRTTQEEQSTVCSVPYSSNIMRWNAHTQNNANMQPCKAHEVLAHRAPPGQSHKTRTHERVHCIPQKSTKGRGRIAPALGQPLPILRVLQLVSMYGLGGMPTHCFAAAPQYLCLQPGHTHPTTAGRRQSLTASCSRAR